jgi:hypothetical protein
MKRSAKLSLKALGASLLCLFANEASAFPHVVQAKETLAGLSTRYYGRVQYERIITAANGLVHAGARGLIPGMILDIPSLTYHRVQEGENWKSLALTHLGDEERSIVLAQINEHKPWIQPEVGQLIVIPYNLTWIASEQDSLVTLAYRFLGSTKHAYRLVQYNKLGEEGLKRGQVLLLPLSELPLTEEGRAAAHDAYARMTAEGQGKTYEHYKVASAEVAQLAQDVHSGRYISAVAKGNQLLSQGELSEPSRAHVQLLLLETYVALEAHGPARTACEAYRALRPDSALDPVSTSPKILKLCPNAP